MIFIEGAPFFIVVPHRNVRNAASSLPMPVDMGVREYLHTEITYIYYFEEI